MAVIGTEAIRRGWRIRPHKVRLRAGRPLRFPQVEEPSKALAGGGHRPDLAVRDAPVGVARRPAAGAPGGDHRRRHVGHQPGRLPRARRARGRPRLPHPGAGAWRSQHTRENARYLPGVDAARCDPRPARRRAAARGPRPRLPGRARQGAAGGARRPRRADLQPRSGCWSSPRAWSRRWARCPSAFAAERCNARAVAVLGGPAHAAEVLEHGASVVLASLDQGFARQLADALRRRQARRHDHHRRDRRRARRLRQERGRAGRRGRSRGRPQHRRRRRRQGVRRGRRAGPRPRAAARRRSPAWPAPAIWWRPWWPATRATAAPASCSRRACPAAEIGRALGHAAEAVDSVPLLAEAARDGPPRRAGPRRACRAGRGPDRARALGGDRDRARAAPSSARPIRAA